MILLLCQPRTSFLYFIPCISYQPCCLHAKILVTVVEGEIIVVNRSTIDGVHLRDEIIDQSLVPFPVGKECLVYYIVVIQEVVNRHLFIDSQCLLAHYASACEQVEERVRIVCLIPDYPKNPLSKFCLASYIPPVFQVKLRRVILCEAGK